jgi:hypothetical protein
MIAITLACPGAACDSRLIRRCWHRLLSTIRGATEEPLDSSDGTKDPSRGVSTLFLLVGLLVQQVPVDSHQLAALLVDHHAPICGHGETQGNRGRPAQCGTRGSASVGLLSQLLMTASRGSDRALTPVGGSGVGSEQHRSRSGSAGSEPGADSTSDRSSSEFLGGPAPAHLVLASGRSNGLMPRRATWAPHLAADTPRTAGTAGR